MGKNRLFFQQQILFERRKEFKLIIGLLFNNWIIELKEKKYPLEKSTANVIIG